MSRTTRQRIRRSGVQPSTSLVSSSICDSNDNQASSEIQLHNKLNLADNQHTFFPETEWRKGKTLVECHEYMLTNQIACDVYFALGPNEDRYGAHKYMLLAVSDVFFLMFLGPMAEKDPVIKVPDVDLNIFKSFLRFMYTGKLDTTPHNVMHLLYLAKKYNIEAMIDALVKNVEMAMCVEDACVIMEQAHIFNVPHLEKLALMYIEDHPVEILKSNHVKVLCPECLQKVLSSNDFHLKANPVGNVLETKTELEAAELEKLLLGCAMTWAKHQCKERKLKATFTNMRKVLGDMIWLIRFSQLKPEYFVGEVSKLNILSTEERCSVLESIVAPRKARNITSTCSKRRGRHSGMKTISRFINVSSDTSQDTTLPHVISFRMSEDVYMHGITLYGTAKGKSCSYVAHLRLYDCKETLTELETVICDKIENFHIRSKKNGIHMRIYNGEYPVLFHRKIRLTKNVLYTIWLQLTGPPTYFGLNGRSEICSFSGEFWKVTFVESCQEMEKSQTSVASGQIPCLLVSTVADEKPC